MKKQIIGSLAAMTLGLALTSSSLAKLDNLEGYRNSQKEKILDRFSERLYNLYQVGTAAGIALVLGAGIYSTGKLEEHSELRTD